MVSKCFNKRIFCVTLDFVRQVSEIYSTPLRMSWVFFIVSRKKYIYIYICFWIQTSICSSCFRNFLDESENVPHFFETSSNLGFFKNKLREILHLLKRKLNKHQFFLYVLEIFSTNLRMFLKFPSKLHQIYGFQEQTQRNPSFLEKFTRKFE